MKHVLVTGSTRGIGLGLAKSFLNLGCKVTINGTTLEGVEKSANELKKLFPSSKVQGFQADMTIHDDVISLWSKAEATFGPIDYFINNAGINNSNVKVWELSNEEIRKVLDVNLLGVINGTNIAFKNMLRQGYGQIFNMEGFGSDGSMGHNLTLYGTTKRAVNYFTHSFAKEAKGTSILVGTLRPGMVVTDLLLKPLEEMAADERERALKIFNILADEVDIVADFLSQRILENKENNVLIAWLTKKKVLWRFLSSVFFKRKVIKYKKD